MKNIRHLKNRSKKSKTINTVLILNDDCFKVIFEMLSRLDLIKLSSIRNIRIRDITQTVYLTKYGNCMKVSHGQIAESIKVIKSPVGHLIKKVVIEFRRHEITRFVNFLQKNVSRNLEELELCHLHDTNTRGLHGIRKLSLFISGLSELFQNLRHLKIDYRLVQWCTYFKNIPVLPSLESLTVIGMVHITEIMKIFTSQDQGMGMWQIQCIRKGYFLNKM